MSRNPAVSWFALVALMAAACGPKDGSDTTSASAGASTPVVTGASTDTGTSGTQPEVRSVTYEQAESAFASGKY